MVPKASKEQKNPTSKQNKTDKLRPINKQSVQFSLTPLDMQMFTDFSDVLIVFLHITLEGPPGLFSRRMSEGPACPSPLPWSFLGGGGVERMVQRVAGTTC